MERVLLAVQYAGQQSFKITFSYSFALQLWGLLLNSPLLVSVQTFQPPIVNSEMVILYIITGDVHQYIDHFLIPLDP